MQLGHKISMERLTTDHQMLDTTQGHTTFFIEREHPRKRGGALKMRRIVAYDLSGERIIAIGHAPRLVGAPMHFGKRLEAFKHNLWINTVVYQAADLVYANALELFDTVKAVFHSAEEAALLKVTLKGKLKDRVKFFRREDFQIKLERIVDTFGLFERGKGPSLLLDETCRCVEIIFHRLTRYFASMFACI